METYSQTQIQYHCYCLCYRPQCTSEASRIHNQGSRSPRWVWWESLDQRRGRTWGIRSCEIQGYSYISNIASRWRSTHSCFPGNFCISLYTTKAINIKLSSCQTEEKSRCLDIFNIIIARDTDLKYTFRVKEFSILIHNIGQDDKNGSITAKLINSNANSTIGQSPSSESDMTGTTHIPLQRGIDDCITDHGGQRHSQASLSSMNDRNPDLIPTSSSSSKGNYFLL